ncbi:hypothetical protein GGR56DRAFT_630952 [Xylariaceae sp. FL0804]|nr:hypothetical protein GGR56DRAFT_630952 [Xylariaceae sp. FL0804]
MFKCAPPREHTTAKQVSPDLRHRVSPSSSSPQPIPCTLQYLPNNRVHSPEACVPGATRMPPRTRAGRRMTTSPSTSPPPPSTFNINNSPTATTATSPASASAATGSFTPGATTATRSSARLRKQQPPPPPAAEDDSSSPDAGTGTERATSNQKARAGDSSGRGPPSQPPFSSAAAAAGAETGLGGDGERRAWTMSSWAAGNRWVVLAIASGACAALNGVFAKLTTNDLTSQISRGISGFLGLSSIEGFLEIVVRCVFFGLNLAFNGVMWTLFTQALARGHSTTQVSIMNTSANFVLTALLGLAVFAESLPPLWWLGAALLVAGNVIIGRGRSKDDGDGDGDGAGGDRDGDDDDNNVDDGGVAAAAAVGAAERGEATAAAAALAQPTGRGFVPVEKDEDDDNDADEDVALLGDLDAPRGR